MPTWKKILLEGDKIPASDINPGTLGGASGFAFEDPVQTDQINEYTSGSGVTIDSVLLKDNTLTASVAKLGTNPASDGVIRLANADWIKSRNAANSGDVSVVQVDANDRIKFGSAPLHAPDRLYVGATYADPGSGGLRLEGNVTIGSSPATAGAIRLPAQATIQCRNMMNDGDIIMLQHTTGDRILIGGQYYPLHVAWRLGVGATYEDPGIGGSIRTEGGIGIGCASGATPLAVAGNTADLGSFLRKTEHAYTPADPSAFVDFQARYTGQGVWAPVARVKWGLSNTQANLGARFALDLRNDTYTYLEALAFSLADASTPVVETSGILGAAVLRLGTNPASAGAIRLANAGEIKARNAANGGDVSLLYLDGADVIRLAAGGAPVAFGTNPAQSGLIRLPNNQAIKVRENTNLYDYSLLYMDTSNTTVLGCGLPVTIDGEVKVSGELKIGTNPAIAGTIRLENAAWIAARNAANGADVNLFKVNASDRIESGAVPVHLADRAYVGASYADPGADNLTVKGSIGIGVAPTSLLHLKQTIAGNGAAMAVFHNTDAATYSDTSPNAMVYLNSTYTGGNEWNTARLKWGYANTYANGGCRLGIDLINTAGSWQNALTIYSAAGTAYSSFGDTTIGAFIIYPKWAGNANLAAGPYIGSWNGTGGGSGGWLNILGCSTGTAAYGTNIGYFNQSSWLRALTVANVASGYGILSLMPDGGTVGIGTTSPGAALGIEKATASSGTVTAADFLELYLNDNSEVAGEGPTIIFSSDYYSGAGKSIRAAIRGGTEVTGNDGRGFLAFYTNGAGANSATEKMRLNSSGYLGIAQTAPKHHLHIGNMTVLWNNGADATAETWFFRNLYWDGANWRRIVAEHETQGMRFANDGYFHFYTNTDANSTADSAVTLDLAMQIAHDSANVWIKGDCSAASMTDRTPYPESLAAAYRAVASLQAKEGTGELDHAALDASIKVERLISDGFGNVRQEVARNLSALVSAQNAVIQDLMARLATLEAR